jgi:heme-degrading monooxygenase HmoA
MIREGMLFAVCYWTVKPGKEEIFLEKWQEFAQWTMNNLRGSRWMFMVRDQEQENRFISFGPWESFECITEWQQSSRFKSAFTAFMELCDEVSPGVMREVIHIKR